MLQGCERVFVLATHLVSAAQLIRHLSSRRPDIHRFAQVDRLREALYGVIQLIELLMACPDIPKDRQLDSLSHGRLNFLADVQAALVARDGTHEITAVL